MHPSTRLSYYNKVGLLFSYFPVEYMLLLKQTETEADETEKIDKNLTQEDITQKFSASIRDSKSLL